ncbi:hypothetical protein [Actinokineospora enzanensis]|uniref:hypothetical protein n=1 Tax=Actinokineospora enzanensis TaxID=155975 RepID=UPI000374985D|nr:hypothetical protein [Actinokineospora enzanensis]
MHTAELRDLVRHPGPFASVYLDFSHDTEDAEVQRRLRWRAARESLLDQGADPSTVVAHDRRRPEPGKIGLVLIGARAATTDEDRLRREIDRARAELEAAEHVDIVAAYQAERGAGAVDGLAAATAALREANARGVLLGPDLAGNAWVSPSSPDQVAAESDALRGLGLSDFTELPADECLPAAAVAVGADLVAVRHEVPLSGGVGVLLRHR